MNRITIDQISELLAQDKAGRVTRENLQRFLLNPNGGEGYTVTVDYGKTVEEMVSAGHYDWHNDNINDTNFKVNGTGVVTVALELVHLDKDASTKEVEDYLEVNGLRSTMFEELLAFGAIYPEIQREFPVVALGSSWVDPDGNRHVAYLSRNGSEQNLNLRWSDDDWSEVCRFLAVRK